MKWVWRFSIYFIKPVLIWWICGYFGWQSVKAIANAISSYERAVKKAEIKARFESAGAAGTNTTQRVKKEHHRKQDKSK